jgi:drug/metabolite transporter (DMT)-like permease
MKLAVLGMILDCIGTFATALGYIFFRIAFLKHPEKIFFKIKRWWLGLIIILAGNLLAVAALAMADQSILSICSCLTMIFNAILAWKILKEKLRVYKIVSIVLMSAGVVIGIAFVPYNENTYSIQEMEKLFY